MTNEEIANEEIRKLILDDDNKLTAFGGVFVIYSSVAMVLTLLKLKCGGYKKKAND